MVTGLLITEIGASEKNRLLFKPEFFIYDGIVMLYSSGPESASRALTLEIIKMRGTKHSRATVSYDITSSGISVAPT
jgi:KaiC/GvpD/RAD55 family RecA-like ATPase